jgi:hypothetical protein
MLIFITRKYPSNRVIMGLELAWNGIRIYLEYVYNTLYR